MLKLAENLELPIDFVTERVAFLARTGAGKSGGMRVMFEQMFDAKLFSIFIDPKGDAYGIRAEGTGPGKPILVMGGDYGDISLEPTAGKVVAEFLVKERISTVLDISDFSTKQMWKFVGDFTQRIYKLNREVVHIFLDEADMVAGQNFYDPDCLHGIQLIQNKGRARGFGMTVATQRPQILNKTVLNASGTLIAMQILGDDALKVVKSHLGGSASKETIQEILSVLPTFQPREAFVYSPQTLGLKPVRIEFASFTTFDSMKTPKPGEARREPKSVADIDLSAVREDMAATIEQVKSNDPNELKKQIADLKRDLHKAQAEKAVETKEIVKEVPVIPSEDIKALSAEIVAFRTDYIGGLNAIRDAFALLDGQKVLERIEKSAMAISGKIPERPVTATRPTPAARPLQNVKPSATPTAQSPERGTALNPRQQKILDILRTFEALGKPSVERPIVATFAGMSGKSGTFETYVSRLKTNDPSLVEYLPGSCLGLTDDGRLLAQATVEINSVDDLHQAWKSQLKTAKQIEMLDHIISRHPEPVSRTELADVVGLSVTSGTFETYLSRTKTLGILEYVNTPDGRGVRATGLLFPEGLA